MEHTLSIEMIKQITFFSYYMVSLLLLIVGICTIYIKTKGIK